MYSIEEKMAANVSPVWLCKSQSITEMEGKNVFRNDRSNALIQLHKHKKR